MINNHKSTIESYNEENDRAEWKIQLVMQNNFISNKNSEDTWTIGKPVKIYMGSDTENSF